MNRRELADALRVEFERHADWRRVADKALGMINSNVLRTHSMALSQDGPEDAITLFTQFGVSG